MKEVMRTAGEKGIPQKGGKPAMSEVTGTLPCCTISAMTCSNKPHVRLIDTRGLVELKVITLLRVLDGTSRANPRVKTVYLCAVVPCL